MAATELKRLGFNEQVAIGSIAPQALASDPSNGTRERKGFVAGMKD